MTDATMLENAVRAVREIDQELTSDEAEEFVRAVIMAVRVPERDAWLSIVRGQPPETRIRDAVENSLTAMIDAILADGEGR